jgi:type II secretory pathway pseudopilin PulG
MTPTPAPPKSNRRALWLAAVVVGVAGLCGIGTLLAIAIPNFIKHHGTSKQAEATYTLQALITAEDAFRAKEGFWATNPRQLVEYANSGPQHYTCFLSPSGRWGGKAEVTFEQLPLEVQARLAENDAAVDLQKQKTPGGANVEADLVIVCAMNLDDDPALDVWSLRASDPIPRHDQDDLGG